MVSVVWRGDDGGRLEGIGGDATYVRCGRIQLQRTLVGVGGSNCGRAVSPMKASNGLARRGELSGYALFCEANEDEK